MKRPASAVMAGAIVRRRIAIVAISVAITVQVGSANPAPARAYDATGDFVTGNGSQLELAGRPYRFVGLNIYNANSDGWCWYPMDGGIFEGALDDIGLGAESTVSSARGSSSRWQPKSGRRTGTGRDSTER